MQEHLCMEPDTCPCKQLLFSYSHNSHTKTQASRYRDCWHPSQLWPKLSAARGHLNPSSGAGHTGPVCYSRKWKYFLARCWKDAMKVNPPFPLRVISCGCIWAFIKSLIQHRKNYCWQIWNLGTGKHSKGWCPSSKTQERPLEWLKQKTK